MTVLSKTKPVVERIDVEGIAVGSRLRQTSPERVAALAESMKELGLQTPISVCVNDDASQVTLVAGATRLAAAKQLGWELINCFVFSGNDLEAQLWEIDENLARAELTPAEVAEHSARRAALMKERDAFSSNLEEKPVGRPKSQRETFIKETAKSTGRAENTIRRALDRGQRIAPDVLQAVKGTDRDKGTHLDKLAKMTPAEQREEIARPVEQARGKSSSGDGAGPQLTARTRAQIGRLNIEIERLKAKGADLRTENEILKEQVAQLNRQLKDTRRGHIESPGSQGASAPFPGCCRVGIATGEQMFGLLIVAPSNHPGYYHVTHVQLATNPPTCDASKKPMKWEMLPEVLPAMTGDDWASASWFEFDYHAPTDQNIANGLSETGCPK